MTATPLPVGTATLRAQREWVRRVARALVADVNAAEDLEQDLRVEVLERPPRPRTSLRCGLAVEIDAATKDAMQRSLDDLRKAVAEAQK